MLPYYASLPRVWPFTNDNHGYSFKSTLLQETADAVWNGCFSVNWNSEVEGNGAVNLFVHIICDRRQGTRTHQAPFISVHLSRRGGDDRYAMFIAPTVFFDEYAEVDTTVSGRIGRRALHHFFRVHGHHVPFEILRPFCLGDCAEYNKRSKTAHLGLDLSMIAADVAVNNGLTPEVIRRSLRCVADSLYSAKHFREGGFLLREMGNLLSVDKVKACGSLHASAETFFKIGDQKEAELSYIMALNAARDEHGTIALSNGVYADAAVFYIDLCGDPTQTLLVEGETIVYQVICALLVQVSFETPVPKAADLIGKVADMSCYLLRDFLRNPTYASRALTEAIKQPSTEFFRKTMLGCVKPGKEGVRIEIPMRLHEIHPPSKATMKCVRSYLQQTASDRMEVQRCCNPLCHEAIAITEEAALFCQCEDFF